MAQLMSQDNPLDILRHLAVQDDRFTSAVEQIESLASPGRGAHRLVDDLDMPFLTDLKGIGAAILRLYPLCLIFNCLRIHLHHPTSEPGNPG